MPSTSLFRKNAQSRESALSGHRKEPNPPTHTSGRSHRRARWATAITATDYGRKYECKRRAPHRWENTEEAQTQRAACTHDKPTSQPQGTTPHKTIPTPQPHSTAPQSLRVSVKLQSLDSEGQATQRARTQAVIWLLARPAVPAASRPLLGIRRGRVAHQARGAVFGGKGTRWAPAGCRRARGAHHAGGAAAGTKGGRHSCDTVAANRARDAFGEAENGNLTVRAGWTTHLHAVILAHRRRYY